MSADRTVVDEHAPKLARLGRVAKEVFALLSEAQAPVKAYDLLWRLQNRRGTAAPPSTIYRALNSLVRAGVVHKVEGISAYVICSSPASEHVPALFICEECKSALELDGDAAAKAVRNRIRRHGFEPTRLSFEFVGVCAHCQSTEEEEGEAHEEKPFARR